MTETYWQKKATCNIEKTKELARLLNIDINIATLLMQRGIETYEAARLFFRPELSDLYDPFLMKDMDKAVMRLERAINSNEKILIYGDYDVDGTTGVAMMYSYLSNFTANISYYIPDRFIEGYGISFKGIDYAIENNISLLISIDCGIKANDKVDYANQHNIDIIICDHHNADINIPAAYAVLDPKRPDCYYPFKELSGCAVAFKFLYAYAIKTQNNTSDIIKYLDLVAVSIGSDIVPINGENRILAYYGLKQLNSEPCVGLKNIIQIIGLEDNEININDIVFKIGPRINAAGRLASGNKAVELLISDKSIISEYLAEEIDILNNNRKEMDSKITKEALFALKETDNFENLYTNVIYNSSWHKGLIGIVASRITETYYRPTIVFTKGKTFLHGSARSVSDYDLYAAIDSCKELLEDYGGHKYAAGLTIKEENLNKFKQQFETYVKSTITESQRKPTINIDIELKLEDITPKFYRILKQFAPFGPENMSPIFLTKNIVDNGAGRLIGKENEHIKLKITQETKNQQSIDAVGFNLSNLYKYTMNNNSFNICYHIDENTFLNQTKLQLIIKDIKPN